MKSTTNGGSTKGERGLKHRLYSSHLWYPPSTLAMICIIDLVNFVPTIAISAYFWDFETRYLLIRYYF